MTDAGDRQPDAPRPDYSLSNLIQVDVSLVSVVAPRLRYVRSYLSHSAEGVELLVRTDGPLPIRALPPVLYVGDVAVVESAAVGERQFRFLALEPERLAAGAPIVLGWYGQAPHDRHEAAFRYEPPVRSTEGAPVRGVRE